MAYGARTKTAAAGVRAERGRHRGVGRPFPFPEPGEDEIGWTARRGRVPLGYLGDRDRTGHGSRSSTGNGCAIPVTGPASARTAVSCSSGAMRWWSTPAGRRCSSRRSRTSSGATPTWPTRSSSADPEGLRPGVVAVVAPARGRRSTPCPSVSSSPRDRPFQGAVGGRGLSYHPAPRQWEGRLRVGAGDGRLGPAGGRRPLMDLGVRGLGYLVIGLCRHRQGRRTNACRRRRSGRHRRPSPRPCRGGRSGPDRRDRDAGARAGGRPHPVGSSGRGGCACGRGAGRFAGLGRDDRPRRTGSATLPRGPTRTGRRPSTMCCWGLFVPAGPSFPL